MECKLPPGTWIIDEIARSQRIVTADGAQVIAQEELAELPTRYAGIRDKAIQQYSSWKRNCAQRLWTTRLGGLAGACICIVVAYKSGGWWRAKATRKQRRKKRSSR